MKAFINIAKEILNRPIIVPAPWVRVYDSIRTKFWESIQLLWTKLGSLCGISILSVILWQAEMFIRWSWKGMEWIASFHFSVIIISLMFAIWLFRSTPCHPEKWRLLRSVLVFFCGIGLFFVYGATFRNIFGAWGSLIWPIYVSGIILTFIWIPVTICFTARSFSNGLHPLLWFCVPLLFYLSAFTFGTIASTQSGIILLGFTFAAGLPFALGKDSPPEPSLFSRFFGI
jgi:hypothetical protein